MTQDADPAHRELRELLGAYVLGGLTDEANARLGAHLDGCAACRAELAEIAPLREALRAVDADGLSTAPAPPSDLGDRILLRIAEERVLRQAHARRAQRRDAVRTRNRQLLTAAAAAVLVVASLTVGTVLGRTTAPDTTAAPPAKPLPIEEISLRALDPSVSTESAVVIAHGWGVEASFTASGLDAGEVYRAAFRAEDGSLRLAGEFLGTGDTSLTCNMQSALLRDDTIGFVVTDEDGRPVLTADL